MSLRRSGRRRVEFRFLRAGAMVVVLSLGLFGAGFVDRAFGMGAALTPGENGVHTVAFVYDGDTVRTSGGLIIRYIGIDTPERGEPFYSRASKRNIELVKGKKVELYVCKGEPKDKYGRTLGWVYVDGLFVNGALLEEGLGRSLIIPPCGTEKRDELLGIESRAQEAGVGIWAK
ncbi:MAG: thermonuclease family protein [Proteobacteria bacterium]|nr:thermonuclease family protein [Pseudomonadota bacterium]